jgi:hypothetical protein
VLAAILVGCLDEKYHYRGPPPSPFVTVSVEPPPTISAAGPPPLTTTMTVSFAPEWLTFSASANKLYVAGYDNQQMVLIIPLSAPREQLKRLDLAIGVLPASIVINEKLRRGYALVETGAITVFSTDSDTLVSTSQQTSCQVRRLAINEATGMVYGSGLSERSGCLVQFDSDGRLVKESASSHEGKNIVAVRLAVDPATGDLLYTSPSSVGRLDQTLTEKWFTPVDGPGEVQDLGFEPKTNTVYVPVGDTPTSSPVKIAVLDGRTGRRQGEFSGPSWTSGFAATGDGRLFVAFLNSRDLFVLVDGASTLTNFASLNDIPESTGTDVKWAVDTAGQRLFVAPDFFIRKILVYQY